MRILPLFFCSKNNPAASAADVASANVVGYTKIQLNEGYNLIGSQFLNVGGQIKDINDFIVDGSGLLGLDDEGMYQTTMRVWDGSSYTYYGWLDSDDGTINEVPEWNNTWLKYDMSDVAIEDMDLGKGVWLITPNATSITVSGEVSSTNTYTMNVATGYNIIANPFPCEVSIQNIKCNLDGLDDEGMYQTTMRVWDGSSYTYYGWLDNDDGTINEVPEWDNSWLLYDMSDLAKEKLKVGQAVWFIAPTDGTVTFTK